MESKLAPADKAALMRRFKSRDTRPEITVRKALHRLGLRFRLHRRDLPGKPDIVLPRHQTAIFVHGCFWHQHAGCQVARVPKTQSDFWREKFAKTAQRDEHTKTLLEDAGWTVMVIWECEALNERCLQTLLVEKFGK